jgi:hypothetical protein
MKAKLQATAQKHIDRYDVVETAFVARSHLCIGMSLVRKIQIFEYFAMKCQNNLTIDFDILRASAQLPSSLKGTECNG